MKQEVKSVESPSSTTDDSPPQRPKRNSCQKNLGTNNGLLWREETDLKRALYASLQESRRKNFEDDGVTETDEEKNNVAFSPQNGNARDDNPKRTKVHAQRKFAQGSAPNSPVPTPMKINNSNSSTNELLPCRRPKTEDFLTFLCLRGSTILPPSYNFLNICSKSDTSSDSRCPSPDSDVLSTRDVTTCKTEQKSRNNVKHELSRGESARRNFPCKANASRPKTNLSFKTSEANSSSSNKISKEASKKRKCVERDDGDGDVEYIPNKFLSRSRTIPHHRTKTSMRALCEKYKQQRLATDSKKSSGSANIRNLVNKACDPTQKMQITTRNKAKQNLRAKQTVARSEQRLALEKRKSLRSANPRLNINRRKCFAQAKNSLWLRGAKLVPPVVDVDSESEPEIITISSTKSKASATKSSEKGGSSITTRHSKPLSYKSRTRQPAIPNAPSEPASRRLRRERSSSQQLDKKREKSSSPIRNKNSRSKIIKKSSQRLENLKKVKRNLIHKRMSLRNNPLVSTRVTRSATKVPKELMTRRPVRNSEKVILPRAVPRSSERNRDIQEIKFVKSKNEPIRKENSQPRCSKVLDKRESTEARTSRQPDKKEHQAHNNKMTDKESSSQSRSVLDKKGAHHASRNVKVPDKGETIESRNLKPSNKHETSHARNMKVPDKKDNNEVHPVKTLNKRENIPSRNTQMSDKKEKCQIQNTKVLDKNERSEKLDNSPVVIKKKEVNRSQPFKISEMDNTYSDSKKKSSSQSVKACENKKQVEVNAKLQDRNDSVKKRFNNNDDSGQNLKLLNKKENSQSQIAKATHGKKTSRSVKMPDKTSQSAKTPDKTSQSAKMPDKTGQSAKMPENTGQSAKMPDKTGQSAKMPDKTSQKVKVPDKISQSVKMPDITSQKDSKAAKKESSHLQCAKMPGKNSEILNVKLPDEDSSIPAQHSSEHMSNLHTLGLNTTDKDNIVCTNNEKRTDAVEKSFKISRTNSTEHQVRGELKNMGDSFPSEFSVCASECLPSFVVDNNQTDSRFQKDSVNADKFEIRDLDTKTLEDVDKCQFFSRYDAHPISSSHIQDNNNVFKPSEVSVEKICQEEINSENNCTEDLVQSTNDRVVIESSNKSTTNGTTTTAHNNLPLPSVFDIETLSNIEISDNILKAVANIMENFPETLMPVQNVQTTIKMEKPDIPCCNASLPKESVTSSSTLRTERRLSSDHHKTISVSAQSGPLPAFLTTLRSERAAMLESTAVALTSNSHKQFVLSDTSEKCAMNVPGLDSGPSTYNPIFMIEPPRTYAHQSSDTGGHELHGVKHLKDGEKTICDSPCKKSDKDQHKSHKDGEKKLHKSGKNLKNSTKKKKSDKDGQKGKKDSDSQKIKKEGESSKSKNHDKDTSKGSKKDDKDSSKTHKKEAEKFFSKVLKKELEREHLKSIKKEKSRHSWEESASGSSKSSKKDSDRESSKSSRKESDRESTFSEKMSGGKSSSESKKDKSSKKLSPKKKKKRDLKNLEKMSKSFLFSESGSCSKYSDFKVFKRRSSSEKSQLKKLLSKAKKRKKLELLKAKKLSKKLSSKLLRKYVKKKGLKLKKNKLKLKKKDLKKDGSSSKSSSQSEKGHHKTKKQKHKNKNEHKKDSQGNVANSVMKEISDPSAPSIKIEGPELPSIPSTSALSTSLSTSTSTLTSDNINDIAVASTYINENMSEGAATIDAVTSDMAQSLQGDLVFGTAEEIQNLMTSDFTGVFEDTFSNGAILLTRDSMSQMPLHFIQDVPPKTMTDAATNTSEDDLVVVNINASVDSVKSEETSVGTQTITPAGSPSPIAEMKLPTVSSIKPKTLLPPPPPTSSSPSSPSLPVKHKVSSSSKEQVPGSTQTITPVKRRRSSSFISVKRNKMEDSCTSTKKSHLTSSSGLVDAPVYRPSVEEFQDPLEYIEKILPEAGKYGICKIIPPASFKPECKVNDDMRFTAHNQYVHKMLNRWGPNVQHVACIRKHLKSQKVTLDQAPLIGGIELDLSKFYHTVQQYGGLQPVIEKKKWQKVADTLHIPKAAQDRVTKLYDAYCKYLVSYETLPADEKKKLREEVIAEHEKRLKSRNSAKDTEKEESEDGDDEENNDCVTKGRSMTLSGFYRVARNTMCMWQKNETKPEEVENQYWKLVKDRLQHVVVHAGNIDSSVYQSGFPCNRSNPFAKHPWNLKVLTNNPNSILRCMGPISGVTIPTLHVGMLFTTGCWYRDPHSLPWIEYLHTGASKIWYGIPSNCSGKFREAMVKVMPEVCDSNPIWLASDTAMVPPDILVKNGAFLSRTIQHSGQFIIIFPESYTSTICSGYCVSESVYFAPSSWLDLAQKTFKDLRDSCEPPSFSLERLLFCVANDNRTSLETLQKILPMLENIRDEELRLRKALNESGLKNSERLPVLEVRDKKKKARGLEDESEQECEICRTHCYVSMVVNTQEDTIYCLMHAIEHILKKDLRLCKLSYTYDKDELHNLVKRTKELIAVRLREAASSKRTPKKKLLREK